MSIEKYRKSDLLLIRQTFARNCNDDEFNLFKATCDRYGLDPFRKQIYAMVFNKDRADKRQLTIVVGIDGLRSLASRSADYRPDDSEPKYVYNESLKSDTNPLGIESCTVKAYKQDNRGEWHAVSGTAYWDEFAPVEKNFKTQENYLDGKWSTMPRLMISKVAEAQALRRGWPEANGLYAEEELNLAQMKDVTASEQVAAEQEERRLRAINSYKSVLMQWSAGEPLEAVAHGKIYDRICEKLETIKSGAELNAFWDINEQSIREFWAADKAAALEVRKLVEQKREHFAKQELNNNA